MASPSSITIMGVQGIGEITHESDLSEILAALLGPADGEITLEDGDVLIVTQKVISKAEGCTEDLDHHDVAAKIALVERESVRILRRRGDLLIAETTHGFICANAGIDLSNVDEGTAVLLPEDPDRSARRLRGDLQRLLGVTIGVIISDTFGRPWRSGVTDIALGSAGVLPILDLRGTNDANGRELQATEICIIDELAGSADLVMGKASNIPAAVIRGVDPTWLGEGSVASDVIRNSQSDLFR